jgi:hypothetical protein
MLESKHVCRGSKGGRMPSARPGESWVVFVMPLIEILA